MSPIFPVSETLPTDDRIFERDPDMFDTVPVLEPAARAFAEANANPPFLFQLPPETGRKILDEVQSGETAEPAIDEEWITVPAATGDVRARIVRPAGAAGVLPVILYI